MGCLETQRELRRNQMIVVAWAGRFLLKAILQLELCVRCKTVAARDVDPPEILTPPHALPSADFDLVKELLIPTERAE